MRGAGRAMFAATLLLIVGTLNIIYGIGALDDANIFTNEKRYILTNLNTLGWVLIVSPIAAHVFGIAAGTIAGPDDFEYTAFVFWFYTVMLTLVPVAVVYHLMMLARPTAPPLSSAAAA